MGWDGMVITVWRSAKSTYGANNSIKNLLWSSSFSLSSPNCWPCIVQRAPSLQPQQGAKDYQHQYPIIQSQSPIEILIGKYYKLHEWVTITFNKIIIIFLIRKDHQPPERDRCLSRRAKRLRLRQRPAGHLFAGYSHLVGHILDNWSSWMS